MSMGLVSQNPTSGTPSVRGKFSGWAGWVLERFHSPARLREFEYIDPISDQTVYLSTGSRYSVLHIGQQQLFFDRATGRFDGTCRSLQERVAGGIELLG